MSQFSGDLQDIALQNVASTFPEGMREPFFWLGSFLRDECNRSLDVLEKKFKDVGSKVTASTIKKMLEGKYLSRVKDPKSDEVKAVPIIAERKFIDLVARVRKASHIKARGGRIPFVETEVWELIRDFIDALRAPDRICKFGLIIGRTGLQKTECLKQYAIRNNHGACVHIEAPDTPSMGAFITELARAYGVGPSHKKAQKISKITENVTDAKTIIIDNVQRLYKPNHGWNQPIFSFLQKLQDDTNCVIVLCCVPEAEFLSGTAEANGYFEQFVGRCGGRQEFLVLEDYPSEEDLRLFARAFAVEQADKNLALLDKLAHQPGRLRVFFNVLQKAKAQAEAEGSKTIPIDLIKQLAKL